MPPLSLLIKPASGLCNMRCRYCFYADVSKHRTEASFGIMTPDTLETLVRKALGYAEGTCIFGFQGGEPTLAGLDFFKHLISLQRKYNSNRLKILNNIQTNGLRLKPSWAEFFALNNFLVGLSLDGSKPIHDMFRKDSNGGGTYDEVQKTAALFSRSKIEYNILCVVNNAIASAPREVYSTLRKHKFLQFIPCLDGFSSSAREPYSLSTENYANFMKVTFDKYYKDFTNGEYVSIRNFDNYVNIIKGRRPEQCGMNGKCSVYFLIEADGSVYPCDFYVFDEWSLGNVNNMSFPKMAKSATAQEFVDISKPIHPKCAVCKWFGLCHGGCRRYREPLIDNKPSLNILCEANKAFFEYAYDRMCKMAAKVN